MPRNRPVNSTIFFNPINSLQDYFSGNLFSDDCVPAEYKIAKNKLDALNDALGRYVMTKSRVHPRAKVQTAIAEAKNAIEALAGINPTIAVSFSYAEKRQHYLQLNLPLALITLASLVCAVVFAHYILAICIAVFLLTPLFVVLNNDLYNHMNTEVIKPLCPIMLERIDEISQLLKQDEAVWISDQNSPYNDTPTYDGF